MQLDVLAFGAHPDDVELYAGGTLAKMSVHGYRTGITDMSRGELGTRGSASRRAKEAKEAARLLKLNVRDNLGFTDGEISVDSQSRLRVYKILREYWLVIIMLLLR